MSDRVAGRAISPGSEQDDSQPLSVKALSAGMREALSGSSFGEADASPESQRAQTFQAELTESLLEGLRDFIQCTSLNLVKDFQNKLVGVHTWLASAVESLEEVDQERMEFSVRKFNKAKSIVPLYSEHIRSDKFQDDMHEWLERRVPEEMPGRELIIEEVKRRVNGLIRSVDPVIIEELDGLVMELRRLPDLNPIELGDRSHLPKGEHGANLRNIARVIHIIAESIGSLYQDDWKREEFLECTDVRPLIRVLTDTDERFARFMEEEAGPAKAA